MFTVIGAVCSDDADLIFEFGIFHVASQEFADFLAPAFLTLLPCADVQNFWRSVFFFAHASSKGLNESLRVVEASKGC